MNSACRISMLTFLCCFFLSGCAHAVIASPENEGIHSNQDGDYFAFYPIPMSQATTAAKLALKQTGMAYDAEISHTPSQTVLAGLSSTQYVMKVTLDAVNPNLTKVTVHADYFGEEALSLRFQHLLASAIKKAGGTH